MNNPNIGYSPPFSIFFALFPWLILWSKHFAWFMQHVKFTKDSRDDRMTHIYKYVNTTYYILKFEPPPLPFWGELRKLYNPTSLYPL